MSQLILLAIRPVSKNLLIAASKCVGLDYVKAYKARLFLTPLPGRTTLTRVNCCDFAMSHNPETRTLINLPLLLCLMMSVATGLVSGQELESFEVNIFGDGNPDNGIEDDRKQLLDRPRKGHDLKGRFMNAGIIKCDGKIRGTAMVIDTREYSARLKGVVLASAAHVIYDLKKAKRFKRCEFHFLAMSELSRYRVKIDLKHLRIGGFDPNMTTTGLEFGEGDWVFLYAPKVWRGFNPDQALAARDFSFSQLEPYQQSGGELRLVAFDSTTGAISVSENCMVVESRGDDLGGGSWKGQLLDDCDSAGGASGGGIVAVLNQQQYLVGIRSGSHWSEQVYPASEYPSGPPDGSIWDRNKNTNFGRAIDDHLLAELARFIHDLELQGFVL